MTVEMDRLSEEFVLAGRALLGITLRSLEAAHVGVTVVQHRVLVLLAALGELGVSALAEELSVNPSNASRLCDRLEKLELVERVPSDQDGRAVCVRLTRKGRRLVHVVNQHRQREVARVLERLPARQAAQAVDVMRAFAEAADEHAIRSGHSIAR